MLDRSFCVYCETEDEAVELLNYLDDEGLRWANGARPVGRTHWEDRLSEPGIWYCVDLSDYGHEIRFSRHRVYSTKYQEVQLDDLIGWRNVKISVNSICDFV